MNNSIDNSSSNCDDEFPQYSSFYENDDNDNNGKDEVVEDHDDDDDTTEIAYFVDATIQDISNHHDDAVNESSNNSRSFDNSIHHNSSYHSNNSNNSHSNQNNNINNSNSIQNNQSTDDCLDALFEADTNEEEFFNQRKVELQEELQLEKERSKLELERLRSGVVDNGDKDSLKGDGNGVRLGKVQDYIGKMKDRGLDSVALVHGYEEDNYEDDESNINIHNKIIEELDNNRETQIIEEIKQNDLENAEDLSLDDEDEDGISNVITNENESDLELSNTQEEQHDSIEEDDTNNNNIHDVVAQKLERDKMIAKLRENYQHHVAQQVTEEEEDTNDADLGQENNNKRNLNGVNNDHDDFISCSLLHNQLKIGFDFIKTSRMEEETRNNLMKSSPRKGGSLSPKKSFRKAAPDFGTPNPYQYPIIHFVDPTSRGENVSQITDASQSSTTQFKAWNRSKTTPPFHSLNLFTKINTIFQIRHNSSLKSIRLKNLRTNTYQEVHDVKFQPQLVTDYISDASEWHRGPLCHVYIAACASLDHYRSKVRPFLRAFVSQVDGAGSGNKDVVSSAAKQAMKKELYQKDKLKDKTRTMKKEQVAAASLAAAKAKDAAGSNASSKYMIIYVPVQPSCLETAINQTEEGNKGGGLLSRFGGSRRASNDSNVGSNPNDWMIDDDKSVMSVEHQLNPAIIRKLTKEQKEIFSKICNDFPNGKTCLLSSLLDKDHELAAESKIQNQEITEVLQTLGKVMVSGFTDRVQSYNNEIRKVLDDKISEDFDWRHYFLVKESLALTYDQMQLPLESLKEYEGLEMKLPLAPESWPAESDRIDQYHKVTRAALSGDSVAFREIIRWSAKDLANLSYFTLTYLFTRQARLIFQLKYPITLVERFTQYIKKVYFLRCSKCEHLSTENNLLLLARIESWILDSCWDIKSTSETLLSFNIYSDDEVDIIDEEERELINSLLELFNFARLRMFKFGDLVYTKNNNVRKALSGRPQDSIATWVPLKELNINRSKKAKNREMIPGIIEIIDALMKEDNAITPWTRKAMLSSYEYENVYLEITDMFIRLNAVVGRFRCAARLSTEQAECYIIRKEFDRASQTLLPTVDLSIAESWDSLLAWRLFRLIFCQRLSGSPPEYLRSITSCFGPKSVASLPSKFINLMIDDLEDVVNNPEVAGHTWGLSSFLGADVEFQSTKGGEFVESSNSLQKKVYKNVCYVGDEVTASLQLKSELPRAIVVDEIKVTFLKYEDYVRRHRSSVQDSKNDIVLNVENPSILTGHNTYRLPWTVMTVGLYVLESVQIKWKYAHFMLDYCTPQYPALCFDVLPNDPTQSIELNPIFLVSLLSIMDY